MKFKRLFAWLLVVVMCFTLVSCQSEVSNDDVSTTEKIQQTTETTNVSQNETEGPILYRVTDKKGNVVWLFGSIHIGKEDFYPLSDYVLNAFDGADSLAVELDIIAFEKSLSLQTQAMSCLVYKDGSTIQDHISQELYDEAVEILKENNAYMSLMDMYCTAFWSSMIESLATAEFEDNIKLGIDRHLIERAYDTDKEILEVESAELQYKMMADFDEAVQVMLLESAIEMYNNPDEANEEFDGLMDLWASGNEDEFDAYIHEVDDTMTDEEKQLYEDYSQAMFTDRNLTMADYAEKALLSGEEVFICVGAAHVIGDDAMADLLAQRGYKVERITQ